MHKPPHTPRRCPARRFHSYQPRLAGDRLLLRHPALCRLVGRLATQRYCGRLLPGRPQSWLVVIGASIFASNIGRSISSAWLAQAQRMVWHWHTTNSTRGVCWCWPGVCAVLHAFDGVHDARIPRTAILPQLALRALYLLSAHFIVSKSRWDLAGGVVFGTLLRNCS